MSAQWKKAVASVAACLIAGSLVIAQPAQAASSSGPARTITATVQGGKGLTMLVVSGTGRTLASKKLTARTTRVSLKTPKISKTTGITVQFVNSTGEYFGPAVLSWNGTTQTKATKVYSRLKNTTAKTIALGTLTIKSVGTAKKQGYAVASKKVNLANIANSARTKAVKGRPAGVGSYGKATGTSGSSVASASVASSAALLADVAPSTSPPPGGQQGEGAVAQDDDTLGGDKDRDGVINAFDVDDDGDRIVDASDANTPTSQVSADNGSRDCGAIRWSIFTNFKATDPNYSGTLNAYGTGANELTGSRSATAIGNTMTMVFQPITQVCGSAVVKTEIKGNSVAYAPSSYQTVTGTCTTGDYQWSIGAGRMCATSGSSYAFGSGYTFSPGDLPSGQDTFSMRVTTAAGNSYEFTTSAGFVFVSHPMLVSYDTGSGEQTINYGSSIPAIAVTSSTVLRLKLYRPQRVGFDGESAQVYDLGGFRYTPDIPNGVNQSGQAPGKCDALTVVDTAMASDTVIDPVAKPTILLEWNLKSCFDAKGVSWSAGSLTVDIQVEPNGPGGNSAQKLFLSLS